jgi:hypothetical protein
MSYYIDRFQLTICLMCREIYTNKPILVLSERLFIIVILIQNLIEKISPRLALTLYIIRQNEFIQP